MAKPGRKPRVSVEEIFAVFRQSNDPIPTTREITEQVNIGRRTLHDRLVNLEEAGTIESKDVESRAKAWWLPETHYGGSPGKKDVSAFVGAVDRMGFEMTVEDIHDTREDAAVSLHNEIRGREILSTVALYELHKGRGFDPGGLEGVDVIGFSPEDAEAAGNIWRSLKSDGKPIGERDTIIGSIALNRNLTVVTDNTRHYERIDGPSVRGP